MLAKTSFQTKPRTTDAEEFSKVPSSGPPEEVFSTKPFRVHLAAHEEYAVYESILFSSFGVLALPNPGTYDIRARLRINDRIVISPVVRITIAPSSPRQLDAIHRFFSAVDLLMPLGSPVGSSEYVRAYKTVKTREEFIRQYHDDARALTELLDDGILRRTVVWGLAGEEFLATRDSASAIMAWTKLQQLRVTADPVSRELIDMTVAGHFVRLRQWNVASERINRVKMRSHTRDLIKLQIDIGQGRAVVPIKPRKGR